MKKTPLEDWIITKAGIDGNRKALEEYQLKQIKNTIEYARENSSFYKSKLINISTDKIRRIGDLHKVPFTMPEDIAGDPFKFLSIAYKNIKRIVSLNTSGTTGEGKRIFFSQEDLNSTIDFFEYGMKSLIKKDDRILVLLPGNSFGSIGDLLKKALKDCTKLCIVEGILKDIPRVIKIIEEEDINCIVGIPIQILYLSRMEREIFKNRIEKVLLSTDYVPKVLVNEIERKCNCKVFDHYGMTEMAYGGGVQCEALEGYHMREVDLYFEIVNPTTGEIMPEGEYGEVVFTTLNRKAMPLIRYRTGDISAFIKKPCPCGSFLKSMEPLQGRINNRILLKNSQYLYLRELDEILLYYINILDYKVYIDSHDRLILEIITMDIKRFNKVKDEIINNLQKLLYPKIGHCMDIQFIINDDNGCLEIKNSMVKRQILDHRIGG